MRPQATLRVEPFFALRAPSLPFEFLEAWSRCAPDREALRGRLREAAGDPGIREALFLASPDLEAALDPWLRGELSPDQASPVERTLVRYLSRMAYQGTPFGLFAGTTSGVWGSCALELAEWRASIRHTRLDRDVLAGIVAVLERDPAARTGLLYRPNTSLYPAAGRLRYAEVRDGDYFLADLLPTPFLLATLERAVPGATLATLAEPLAQEAGVPVSQRPFTIEEAKSAREAFITAASTFVLPVVKIDGAVVADGAPGPVSRRLRALYLQNAKANAV